MRACIRPLRRPSSEGPFRAQSPLRVQANLTQETVAHRAEMDRATYNRIEQGHSAALIDTLIRTADVIGVPLSDLVRE
ncbi:helix-turn-helix transcriptional regulator [Streptomyces sp. NPDC006283]|uniref:helix-turn-helix domain-containing protein n=1 Tax=Streptomyces sp. NPDC006283 TaxID=3156741 RepID=UPI0033B4AD51